MNLDLFANRNFVLVLFRQCSFEFGTICLNVSFALYILGLTGSAGKFASILALGVIPQIVLGPFAGVWADRLDKRKLLFILDLTRACYLLLLFLLSCFSPIGEEIVYLTVLLFAVIDLFTMPAFVTLLQHVVKKEQLTQANALTTTVVETMRVLAPVLGTLVYGAKGIGAVFLLNALFALISTSLTRFMHLPRLPKAAKHSSIILDLWNGLNIFRTDIRITSLVINGVLTHLFMFPFVMLGFPYMIKQVFGGSDLDFGLVESAQTIGSICSIIGVTWLQKRFPISKNIGIGIVGMVAAVFPMLLLGSDAFLHLMRTSPLAVLIYYASVSFLLFLMFSTYGVFFRTFYLQTVDPLFLGRFLAVMGMTFALGRFAGFHLYGALFDSAELVYAVIVLGIGMLLKILTHIPFLRDEKKRMQRMDSLEDQQTNGGALQMGE